MFSISGDEQSACREFAAAAEEGVINVTENLVLRVYKLSRGRKGPGHALINLCRYSAHVEGLIRCSRKKPCALNPATRSQSSQKSPYASEAESASDCLPALMPTSLPSCLLWKTPCNLRRAVEDYMRRRKTRVEGQGFWVPISSAMVLSSHWSLSYFPSPSQS